MNRLQTFRRWYYFTLTTAMSSAGMLVTSVWAESGKLLWTAIILGVPSAIGSIATGIEYYGEARRRS